MANVRKMATSYPKALVSLNDILSFEGKVFYMHILSGILLRPFLEAELNRVH
jgi:hypothetical protein